LAVNGQSFLVIDGYLATSLWMRQLWLGKEITKDKIQNVSQKLKGKGNENKRNPSTDPETLKKNRNTTETPLGSLLSWGFTDQECVAAKKRLTV
jgi:hypothetical protein